MVHLLRLRQRARKGLLTRNSSQFLPIENIKRRRGEKGEGRRRGEEKEKRGRGGGREEERFTFYVCLLRLYLSSWSP